MSRRYFSQLCEDCEIRSEQDRKYAQAGYQYMQNRSYDEICYKSERQLRKETRKAIRKENNIGLIWYWFLYAEINRIAKLVVNWVLNFVPPVPEPPIPVPPPNKNNSQED